MNTNLNRPFNLTAGVGTLFQLADGSIQGCNKEAEKILGYGAEELIKADYFNPPWRTVKRDGSIFLPKAHPGIISLKTGKPLFSVIMGFYQPTGNLIWLSVDTQPLFQQSSKPYAVTISFVKVIEDFQEQMALEALETIKPIQKRNSKEPKLLLVEDNLEDRIVYRRYLQKNTRTKYTFLEAESGEAALQIASEFQPDLVLLDYLLPDMDGLEWLSLWQQQNLENLPPVIVLTGQRDENVAIQFLKLGAVDYLIKDQLTSEKLQLEVTKAISESQLRIQHQETLLKLQLATDASGVGLWFWDLTSDNLEWTEQCNFLFGLTPDTEISYELFLSILHPEDRDRADRAVKQALINKTEYKIEYRVIWSDGSVHWISAKGKGFYNQDGEPLRMMGTAQDITQQQVALSDLQIAEESMRRLNQRVVDILESMSDAFYTLDPNFNFTYINQEAEKTLKRSKQELLGKNFWLEFPLTVGTEIETQYRQALEAQVTTRFEYYYAPFEHWYEISVDPYVDGLSIYFRNITNSKLAAIQLQANERLLRLALSSAKAGSWDLDILTSKLIWSPETYELYGVDPLKETLEYQDWANALHPEDIIPNQQKVQEVILGQSTELKTEFRIIHPQKGVRWLSGIGNVVPNDSGEPIHLSGINLDITERKLAEEALRDSENRLRNILDSLMIFAGIMTTDGEIIELNQTALNSVSLPPEEILHQKFCETYWWSYDPEIKAQIKAAIVQAANGERVRYDIVARVAENKFILVDFSLVPVFNAQGQIEYLIPSGIDVSDREASKQALKESEDELRLITEVIPQQIWTALPSGEIDYINQRWEEFTGISLPKIQKLGWDVIVHPEDLAKVKENWAEAIQSGNRYDIEARLRGADGKYCWFLGRARPLRNKKGKIIKWYGTNTDITLIKELEEKLRQQAKDLTKANQLKDEFLAIVSHELRTPLNPILGWSQLLNTGKLNPEKIAIGIETIERNAKLQAQLIDDLLDVSRILRGKLNLNATAVNLEFIIKSALATVALSAEAKSIQMETCFEANIGQVSGDAGRLQQIVWNLLANAIKFTPEGGKIAITLERIANKAQIEVKDTGQGIESDFLPYVFDRFRQAESTTTRKFGGLGLGLAIVRHLTELHGGTVAVTSPGKNQGATFNVKLPLMNTPAIEQPDNNPINQVVQPDRFRGIHVLAIDDEPDSRDLLTFVLEQEGADVTPVASAKAALEALKKSIPHLIISDIGMPGMDGYTLMSQIRNLPQCKNIPAIALTAYAGEVDRQRSLDVGFQKHISKPINIPELIEVIVQLIAH